MLDNWWLYAETGLDSILIRFWVSVFDIAGGAAVETTFSEQDGLAVELVMLAEEVDDG